MASPPPHVLPPFLLDALPISRAQAVAHTVETREVRRYFTRHNQVVGSKGIVKVRAVDLNGLSSLRHQLVNSCAVRFHHAWLPARSEEHTSELQSRFDLVCRLL